MLTNYKLFFQQHGVRERAMLNTPPLATLDKLILPINSVYHHTQQGESIGVDDNDPVVQHVKDHLQVGHVYEPLVPPQNIVGKRNVNPTLLISEYLQKHRTYRRLMERQIRTVNQNHLIVYNYGILDKMFVYQQNYMTSIHKWNNYIRNVFANIERVNQMVDRHHFLVVEVPTTIPAPNRLNAVQSGKMWNAELTAYFANDDMRFIAELWVWLSGVRKEASAISLLSENALSKTNIIWVAGNQWTVMNLHRLIEWMREPPTTLSFTQRKSDSTLNNIQAQRALLGFVAKMQSAFTADTSLVGNDVTAERSDDDVFNEGAETENVDHIMQALDQVDAVAKQTAVDTLVYKPYEPKKMSLEDGVMSHVEKLAAKGGMQPQELERFKRLANRYKTIPAPDGSGTLEEFIKIDSANLQIPEQNLLVDKIDGVLDQSMLSCSMQKFHRDYILDTFAKDKVRMGLALQRGGFAVEDYNVQTVEDLHDHYEIHTIRVVPPKGSPSTLRIQYPVVDEDGYWRAGGVRYRNRIQPGDLPIRKVTPSKVALTSYFNKMSITRSKRAAFDYDTWILNQITSAETNGTGIVKNARYGEVHIGESIYPRILSTLAKRYTQLQVGEVLLCVDPKKQDAFFKDHKLGVVKDWIPVGLRGKDVIYLHRTNLFGVVNENGVVEPLGTIEHLMGISPEKRPLEYVEVGLNSGDIPLGLLLAHRIGLGNLLQTLGVEARRVKRGSNYNLGANEFIIKFNDEALILNRTNPIPADKNPTRAKQYASVALLNGFNRVAKDIEKYSIYEFDKPDVYANVMDKLGMSARNLRETSVLFDMWVDPITEELLVDMGEPTDLFQLFIRAAELLEADDAPREMSPKYMRDKGYERHAGIAYSCIVNAVRSYYGKNVTPRTTLDLNPQDVIMKIKEDSTKQTIEDSNPIHSLKETEVVVMRGHGGRSTRSMTEKTRTFIAGEDDGVRSEATVDSGDVATVLYNTPDCNYTSVRGMTRRITPEKAEQQTAKMVSTSMLLAPFQDTDDPKRANFTSVQNSATTFLTKAIPLPVRTGYERVLAHRTNDMFAKTARLDGQVLSMKDGVLVIRYSDNREVGYQLGRRFGRWGGDNLPHSIKTTLREGQTFKKGDLLIYNENYFKVDKLFKGQSIYKGGVIGRFAFMEIPETLEDSQLIHERFSDKLVTKTTHIQTLYAKHYQEIVNLVKVGDIVDTSSILCTITSPIGSGEEGVYDDETMAFLQDNASASPNPDYPGVIEKIETIYTGEVDTMSPTLREVVERHNTQLYRTNRRLKRNITDSRVDVGFRSGKTTMEDEMVIIRVYITTEQPMGAGDKGVVANQLKSIVAARVTGLMETLDGREVDGIFAFQSADNRIVNSAVSLGIYTTLCVHATEEAVAAYFD